MSARGFRKQYFADNLQKCLDHILQFNEEDVKFIKRMEHNKNEISNYANNMLGEDYSKLHRLADDMSYVSVIEEDSYYLDEDGEDEV